VDGESTSFCHDVWDGDDSLAERFPELYSHCTRKEITVRQVYDDNLERSLVVCPSVEQQGTTAGQILRWASIPGADTMQIKLAEERHSRKLGM
jgi:hypothetical protein